VATAAECAQKAIFPLLDRGDIALARGAASAALDTVARVRAAAPGYRILLHDAARIEAAAWGLQGRYAEAERLLQEVIRAAERYRLQPTRWRAGVALAELLAARGRPAEARQHAAVVVAALEAFARELSPATLVRSFLERPLLVRARALAARS
jgi:hypothetical protein